MWVSIDLCVVPIGVGVSLSPYIATCEKVIRATGLTHQLGPNGTAIEGPWDEVMECVRACHDGPIPKASLGSHGGWRFRSTALLFETLLFETLE